MKTIADHLIAHGATRRATAAIARGEPVSRAELEYMTDDIIRRLMHTRDTDDVRARIASALTARLDKLQ